MSDTPFEWSELDRRTVDTIRVLAADSVERAGSGHPGTAMSLAPAAYLLFQRIMRHDPADPHWAGRDRFVLSCGHSSLTLYLQLFLAGYGLEIEDLRQLRQFGSRTPGHPEYGHTAGVETTTGPLGQGLGNAVGMAMAARYERGLLDPDAPVGQSPFDHHIYALCSDGDVEEGVTHEVSALAGHQQLGNLVVIYDDNHISIEDDTDVAKSEDVAARYEAYGWHVQRLDWTAGDEYREDPEGLYRALQAARQVTDRPSFISLRTIIGWPAPTKQNTGAAHGSALGADEVAATKKLLGFDESTTFQVADDVLAHARAVGERAAAARQNWQHAYDDWAERNPDGKALHDRLSRRELPAGWTDALPTFEADEKGMASRKASGKVIDAVAGVLPELWGGSADLAGSNNTTISGAESFLPREYSTDMFTGNPYGRVLHFGIREHGMGSILNGMVQHGGTRPYGGTFLVFSDYMRPAVRLAALMELPVIYVWTHDSIGLGGDGPTHQPVEHLTALRAIPRLDVVRPADANETAWAWRCALEHTDRPTALVLSRQNLPTLDRERYAAAELTAKGGYVLTDTAGGGVAPEVVLIATGSEVSLALAAADRLQAEGTPTRVVSMPCREWFDAQPRSYRDQVLPPRVTARVSVEAGVAASWRDLIGDSGESVSLEHYGASAPGEVLFEQFGFTVDTVVAAAHRTVERAAANS